jgi:hypothetical protein
VCIFLCSCCLTLLLLLTHYLLLMEKYRISVWNTAMATCPYFNCQIAALEHVNSPTRAVIIITLGVTTLMCNTIYQTYLLNSLLINDIASYSIEKSSYLLTFEK